MRLPPPPLALIGREAEIARVGALIAGGERLVTLIGPGGIGKTRLARECVARALNPAVFCDLSEARSGDELVTVVGAALGVSVRRESAGEAVEQLGGAIASRPRLLLVLDNLEQILGPAAQAIEAWLIAAPALQIVATSREALGFSFEQRLDVPPLSARGAELFEAGARRVRANYQPDAHEKEAIERLVVALDGLPLAIELAAARINVLRPQEMLERMEDRFTLLESSARDRPARHRTLRAALDWSWDLLEPIERAALSQASVFLGGFTREAANAVLELQSDRRVIDVIQSLQDKSLLGGEVDAGGAIRFKLLPHIRAYAAERLENQVKKQTSARLIQFVLDHGRALAAQIDKNFTSRPLERLALERENLIAAIEALLEEKTDNAALVDALALLELISSYRGTTRASVTLFDRALENCTAIPAQVAQLCFQRGRVLRSLGAFEEAIATYKRGLANAGDDLRRTNDLRIALAHALIERSHFAEAKKYLQDAEVTSGGDARLEAAIAGATGLLHHLSGDPKEAKKRYIEAIKIHRKSGAILGLGEVLPRMGFLEQELGHLDEAEAYYLESAEVAGRTGRAITAARVIGYFGNLARRRGKRADAESNYRQAVQALREAGELQFAAVFLMDQGILDLLYGDRSRADQRFVEALSAMETIERARSRPLIHGYRGVIAADSDQIAEAERCFATADRLLEGSEELLFAEVVKLQRGHLDLAVARAAQRSQDQNAEKKALEKARKKLDEQKDTLSEHREFAEKMLSEALRRLAPPDDSLALNSDATKTRLPGGEEVDLASRESLRGILKSLATHRAPHNVDQLFAAGWPGQKAQETSKANRVRVALAELRKLGLPILTRGSEYLLDPEIEVVTDAQI